MLCALDTRLRRAGVPCLLALLMPLGAAAARSVQSSPEATDSGPPSRLRLVDDDHLPLGTLPRVLDELRLQLHVAPHLATVHYQPPIVGDLAATSASGDDLGLSSARIWLRRGLRASPPGATAGEPLLVEQDGVAVLSVLNGTPDVVEPLFYSLLLARLHQRHDREPLFAQGLLERAVREFGNGAPPTEPSEARSLEQHLVAEYMMASASFASHLLSLANEIQRAISRRGKEGRAGLCSQQRQGLGLFSLWKRAFDADSFPVSTFAPDGGERTRNVTREQRRWVVETLLPESGWRGRRADLADLCGADRP